MGVEQTNEHAEAVAEEPTSEQSFPNSVKKVERIAQQSKGLFDDVKDWIDLKIKLTELEIREKIKERQSDVIAGVVIGVFLVIAVVFGLVAAALGLGAWLGHPAWGFLVVTGLLLTIALVVYGVRFSGEAKDGEKPDPAQKALAAPSDQKTLPPGPVE